MSTARCSSRPTTARTARAVEDERHRSRHGDGQGHQSGGGWRSPVDLTNVNGTLYFTANDGAHGESSGRRTAPPPARCWSRTSPLESLADDFVAVNGAVDLYAFDGAGWGLFRSDGTATGTIELAANIQSGADATTYPAVDFNGDPIRYLLQNTSEQPISTGHPGRTRHRPLLDLGNRSGRRLQRRQPFRHPSSKHQQRPGLDLGHQWKPNRRRGCAPSWPLGRRSEQATSTAIAIPTSFFKTRAAARSRSGK